MIMAKTTGMPTLVGTRLPTLVGHRLGAEDPSTTAACPITATQVIWAIFLAGGAFGVGLAIGTTWGAKSLRSG